MLTSIAFSGKTFNILQTFHSEYFMNLIFLMNALQV